MQLTKIPATIITGFLGSGKTTFISNILRHANGKRIAVIVNEFGERDIDSDLLRSCQLSCDDKPQLNSGDSGIYELANGCICCTVEEEFLPVMKTLVSRRSNIDHIIIETSGLALPKPLVQAFNWPEIRQHCTVDAVITIIDGPAVADGRYADNVEKVEQQRKADENLDHDPSLKELLEDQLSAADLVLISKTDLLDDQSLREVEKNVVKRISASVKTISIHKDSFSDNPVILQGLLGVQSASETTIDQICNHHDRHHAEGAHHDHAHDHFNSCVITMGGVDSVILTDLLKKLVKEFKIYRAKGFAFLPEKPLRQVVQVVGERIDTHFDRLWGTQEHKQTQLVFIGKGLDGNVLKQALCVAEIGKVN